MNPEPIRKPSIQELQLIKLLVSKSSVVFPPDWEEGLMVRPMLDGGMGSLTLLPKNIIDKGRKLGMYVCEYQFSDADGVVVFASLNIDKEGELFELDMWKTDFNPLIRFPESY